MRKVAVCLAVFLSVACLLTTASAQLAPSSNYTSFDVFGDKSIQLGYYGSANKKDCTSAPLPTIRVVTAPKSGTFSVRRVELKTSKIEGCPELKVNAQVAFYQARSGSSGTDHLVYEVTSPNGEVGTYDVTINIKDAAPEPGRPSPGSKI